MKKILLTIIIAFTVCGAYSQWINQNVPIGFQGYINDMEVVDSNTVWGNPWDGTTGATTPYTKNFARTIDGGNTWTVGTITGSPASALIANIWPIDADTCYVSMYGSTPAAGGVFKTTDGGTSWAEVGTNMFTSASSFPDVVYFWDAQNGMAMGDPVGNPLKYEIYLTSDWGNTWTQVPPANIPALTNNAEYGITNLFSAAGGRIWFGTTYGDVYRSIDGGNNWTKSATGFPPFNNAGTEQDITDIAFSDSLHGLALQIPAAPPVLLKQTADGGLTWTDVIPTGTFYPTDMDGVPGTTGGVFVSSGSSTGFGFGTSMSIDNGLTWTDLDAGASHTAIDFADINTGWTGEFIAAGSPGGAWKFAGIPPTVACGSPNVSPGTTVANDNTICFGDTLTLTTTGVLAPTDGATHGFSIIVSTADISGNNDPLNSGSVIGGTGVILGPPPATVLVNDGSIFAPGIYYFTPVVYGNATGTGNVTSLILDPACTNTGLSVMVNLLVAGDPLCTVGIDEQAGANSFSIKNIYPVPAKDKVNFILTTKENGNVSVSVKDLLGKEVFSKQFATVEGGNNLSFDLSAQRAGIYFLTVTGSESTVVSKFVKE
jgi:photosystem II stability/assembly factor-like uncharacterized protein